MALGNCIEELFIDRNSKLVRKFQNTKMTTLSELDDNCSLDAWFEIGFESGVFIEARLCEDN
jgi:hypothetical protein